MKLSELQRNTRLKANKFFYISALHVYDATSYDLYSTRAKEAAGAISLNLLQK